MSPVRMWLELLREFQPAVLTGLSLILAFAAAGNMAEHDWWNSLATAAGAAGVWTWRHIVKAREVAAALAERDAGLISRFDADMRAERAEAEAWWKKYKP